MKLSQPLNKTEMNGFVTGSARGKTAQRNHCRKKKPAGKHTSNEISIPTCGYGL